MVIGKYDGNVAVYDVHLPTRAPQYESNSVSNKHGGIVWEYICTTDSGVVCVDIHPKYPYLMVIGKYDGNVAVYDVHLPTRTPQYESNSVSNKHGGIVWEVRWGPDMPDGEINFFSV
ncbi:unnamed protein product, partial [Timema podura]|nr:unnamed protein product [Timema podura]